MEYVKIGWYWNENANLKKIDAFSKIFLYQFTYNYQ